jgi:hypothetical protein
MYKFIAEWTDGHGNVISSRTYEAPQYSMAIHPIGKTGDVTLTMDSGLHTPINIGESAWHLVKVFKPDGTWLESLTCDSGKVLLSKQNVGDRP